MGKFIDVQRHGKIAEVLLDRPETYNAFNLEMISSLAEVLTRLATDDQVKGIVLAGKGKAFCAGGDLKWGVQFPEGPLAAFHTLAGQLHLAVAEIKRMGKPVVGALHGAAAGAGFSLALACDFRVMEKSAFLLQAYTSNGLCIDGGGTFTLPRLVGLARALEIAAFDEKIGSEQALGWGLVTKVVEDGKAFEEALSMLDTLSQKSMQSFGVSKRLLNDSFNTSLEAQLEAERRLLGKCVSHSDGKEGLNAFVEKRRPVFSST
ncbi:MAG: enoyl-CoA hydratase/isomerase family protein [Deltaproteobacteria bacterium]|nr:enoyl-CoA hydratase/isomerase family protein [Deltaproteobacteria bacterium]